MVKRWTVFVDVSFIKVRLYMHRCFNLQLLSSFSDCFYNNNNNNNIIIIIIIIIITGVLNGREIT